jgi:hypothetical protein
MSSVNPETLAIGGAVVVAGVAYFMLRGGGSTDGVRDTLNPVTGFIENEADRVLDAANEIRKQKAAGDLYTLLEDAWKPYKTPDFDWEVFAKKISDIDRIRKSVSLDDADKAKLDGLIANAKKGIMDMVNGRTATKLAEAVDALKRDDVQTAKTALAKVDAAVNGTLSPNFPPAVLSDSSQRQYRIVSGEIGDRAKATLSAVSAATSSAASTAKTLGAGLEHLLADNAYAIMAEQWAKMSLDEQKAYTAQLTDEQRNKLRQAILARKAREGR